MVKINFQDNITKANANTFNTMQDNIEDAINDENTIITNYVNDKTTNDYVDIKNSITKVRPSDLEVYSAYAKQNANMVALDIIFRTNTGFTSGGAAEYIATLPASLRPSQAIRSMCIVTGDYTYASWDGISSTNTYAWLYITTIGNIYIRFANPGATMKTAQIHIVY